MRYLLSPELLFGLSLFELLPPESPPVLPLEELPEEFSVLPEVEGAPESDLPLPLSLAEFASDEPSDLPEDEEAWAEPLRA